MKPIRLAYLNLTRHRLTTFIAIAALAIAVGSSGVLLRIYSLSNSRFTTLAKGGDGIVGAKAGHIEILLGSLNLEGDYPEFIPANLFDSLRGPEYSSKATEDDGMLHTVIPILVFGKFKNYRVMGTDESFLHRARSEDNPIILTGKWYQNNGEVVIGSHVAQEESLKVGDKIKISPWVGNTNTPAPDREFVISGIIEPTNSAWDNGLYSTVEVGREIFREGKIKTIWDDKILSYFLVYMGPKAYGKFDSLINQRTVSQAVFTEQAKVLLESLTGTGRILGAMISALIIFLAGLCVSALMITRFDAMGTEIAVLRALGYTKKEITSWLLYEGLMMSLPACLLGALIDLASFPILKSILSSGIPMNPLVTISIFQSSIVWIAAVVATVLALLIPLARVYRQDVHITLRGI